MGKETCFGKPVSKLSSLRGKIFSAKHVKNTLSQPHINCKLAVS